MSEIRPGDLVMLVRTRPCCGQGTKHLGRVYRVHVMEPESGRCDYCGTHRSFIAARPSSGYGYNVVRLKRIAPFSEPETIEHREPVGA